MPRDPVLCRPLRIALGMILVCVVSFVTSCSTSPKRKKGCYSDGTCYENTYGGNTVHFYKKLIRQGRIDKSAANSCFKTSDSTNFKDISLDQAIFLYVTFHMEHEFEHIKSVESLGQTYEKYIKREKKGKYKYKYKSCIIDNDYVISLMLKEKKVSDR